MTKNFYFLRSDDEICWNEQHFQNIMEQEGLTEIEVFKAEPIKEKGVFWCSEHSFCGEDTTDTCGKNNCELYEPRNRKNGRCRFHSTNLFDKGEKVILKKNGKRN